MVSTEEIEREDSTLNSSRYVLPPIGEDVPPLAEAVAAFKQALAEARAAEDRLRRVLVEDRWLEQPVRSVHDVGERNGYAEAMLAKSEFQREALNLSAEECIELVVGLWDSLVPGGDSGPRLATGLGS